MIIVSIIGSLWPLFGWISRFFCKHVNFVYVMKLWKKFQPFSKRCRPQNSPLLSGVVTFSEVSGIFQNWWTPNHRHRRCPSISENAPKFWKSDIFSLYFYYPTLPLKTTPSPRTQIWAPAIWARDPDRRMGPISPFQRSGRLQPPPPCTQCHLHSNRETGRAMF